VGTNGSPQEGQAARQRQSRHAMPAAPGMPGAAPPDPGHGGESADDGCAGTMPAARWPGSGEPGGRQVPGRVSHPARTRSRASTGTRCAHQRRIRDGARPGQRHLAGVPGRRLMPAAQPARSAGTPPGDDDLDAAAAHPGQGGGRGPALPAGQQPARGTLATGHGGHAARRPGERQRLPRPGSTTGTDPDVAGPLRRRCPRLPTVSRLTGPERQVIPSRHRQRSRRPGAHSCTVSGPDIPVLCGRRSRDRQLRGTDLP
jgi:hypothetical protein